ncbi:MAG: arginine repressor, partial [Gemmatimonadales bacterium]
GTPRGGTQAMSHERRQRHLKILELVATRPLRTQDDLADALNQEGWEVTQSSVSRDMAALGLIKIDGIYQRPAAARVHDIVDPNERRIAESLLSVETAGDALLVLHTPPGEAQRVGSAIDLLAWSDVVGTIGGDDTIFLATRNHVAQGHIDRQLRALMGRDVGH